MNEYLLRCCLLILGLWGSASVFSQNYNDEKKKLNKFLKEYKTNPKSERLNYELGRLYYVMDDWERAFLYFNRIDSLDSYEYVMSNYYKGYIYSWNRKESPYYFEWSGQKDTTKNDRSAMRCFEYFLKNYDRDDDKRKNVLYHLVRYKIGQYEENTPLFLAEEKKITEHYKFKNFDTLNVAIENLGDSINSDKDDFAPTLTPDEKELFFTSNRSGKEKFYYSEAEGKEWKKGTLEEGITNSADHESANFVTPDGQRIYFSAHVDYTSGCELYYTEKSGLRWKDSEWMGYPLNTNALDNHPTLTSDERTLIFSSERRGLERKDLYISHKGKYDYWSEPENLGEVINTEYGKEVSPYLWVDNKTLYFSSSGYIGFGGYDIYKTELQTDGSWSMPKNLGYPINTEYDEKFFVLSASGKHGYVASNRPGTLGGMDIFRIDFDKPANARITTLSGIITDEKTKHPLEAQIVLVDNESQKEIARFSSNSATGKYLVILQAGKNYGISVRKEGYLFHSENFDIPKEAEFTETGKNIELKRIIPGEKIILRNIFFDFAKSTLRPESFTELDLVVKIMKENPDIKVRINGHTDNVGSDESNIKLSQGRAQSVVDYLTKRGINKDRIVAKGFGETQPVMDNGTDEGRQLNRRIEFEIIGWTGEKQSY